MSRFLFSILKACIEGWFRIPMWQRMTFYACLNVPTIAMLYGKPDAIAGCFVALAVMLVGIGSEVRD